jgi:uncharacterized membrane protein (DUF485 family)
MTETHGTPAGRTDEPAEGRATGTEHRPDIDWVAAERSPEFRELVKKKNAFVIPATIFFLAWYTGFVLLAGYAPDFMGEEFLVDGLTVGYMLALTQFVMVWGLAAWYLRKSDRVFDPLAKRAAERALEAADGRRAGRFERGPADVSDEEVTRR